MAEEDRDEELDALEEDLRQPYIAPPDEIKEGEGQICFLNADRPCLPDCTAFNIYAQPAQGPERCTFLLYAANLAVNTQELVQLGRKMTKQSQTQAADEARAAIASMPIPDPFGGPK